MVAQGEYGKVDPRNTQIMALTTKIHKMEEKLNDKSSAHTTKTIKTKGPDTPGLDKYMLAGTSLQKWCLKKQGDGSDSIVCDGR